MVFHDAGYVPLLLIVESTKESKQATIKQKFITSKEKKKKLSYVEAKWKICSNNTCLVKNSHVFLLLNRVPKEHKRKADVSRVFIVVGS